MKKALNLKNMKETYLNSDCDSEVWAALYTLHCAGMIDRDTWIKFFDTCQGWTFVDGRVIDIQFVNGEPVEKVVRG